MGTVKTVPGEIQEKTRPTGGGDSAGDEGTGGDVEVSVAMLKLGEQVTIREFGRRSIANPFRLVPV
jgi:hypothetical protein